MSAGNGLPCAGEWPGVEIARPGIPKSTRENTSSRNARSTFAGGDLDQRHEQAMHPHEGAAPGGDLGRERRPPLLGSDSRLMTALAALAPPDVS